MHDVESKAAQGECTCLRCGVQASKDDASDLCLQQVTGQWLPCNTARQ